MDHSLVTFLIISVVVIVTPGQDTALTIRNTLLGGRSAGIATAVGVAMGQFVWTAAATVGITALLVASGPVFTGVKLAGGLYLIYLGASSLWSALRGSGHGRMPADSPASPSASDRRALRQGLLSNLGNPKMVVFFSSLLPQFTPVDGPTFAPMLGLGLAFCSMTLIWLTAYAGLVAKAGAILRRARVRRTVDAVTGAILVVFGTRLAAESA